MRDTAKLMVLGRDQPSFTKSEIRIYSSAGEGMLVFSVHTKLRLISLADPASISIVVPRKGGEVWVDI